jgi:hypothetical protein
VKAFPADPRGLISFIILTDDPSPEKKRQIESDCYWMPAEEALAAGAVRLASLRSAHSNGEDRKINTPWIVLLEADEFLLPQDMMRLAEFCKKKGSALVQLSVTRFVATETMSRFSWVTTVSRMKHAAEGIRKYQTLEARLFPAAQLDALRISRPQPESPARFSIQFDRPGSGSIPFCPALI